MTFADRADAGRQLAEKLLKHAYTRPLVLALPRGGVPVGREVARALKAPLDTLVARKIGAPFNPEWAVGAIAPHDVVILDDDAMKSASVSRLAVEGTIAAERKELTRRINAYRSGSFSAGFIPKTVVVVDDGVATGLTARAALRAARARYPKVRLVFAAPVCIGRSEKELAGEADDIVCLTSPAGFYAVGQAYERFEQVTDDEVLAYLKTASKK
ncbi:hypothetical protein A3C20_00075 [Candidatus Kaiserbacteria bacterium RIFCSPHIGHO2_02_FULL_55_25]|uniref:Phosphoribosyltransferase domain-containing protein n=1 Tax=Candidatus Kaiserbacteria bacterium RIFCSPHIGHO2_02_FULL_55_25 TaxID=1798498 RepID=A0A1F6E875_9BACT|nr:MAG: hypothetical protein A2764_01645 [Candidatus Kaiserbacteria bacterium RIFCSPHIGHO2_01_FULL_55_79]OGG69750.1 MAG: hypothetical protein A3C20_00075 [Candidatus Kaiserbacteria bacterium RIFCSPHIGHO2_02_FULL_55_25]OGG77559.1 MAG: hypothetical protein A3F56_01995 [Candidatus Kaiserbacteria bacterium RIFCSPHIGHO2_12_FULL_55_13]